jgi:CRP-like cAMP-binding protein
MNTFINDGSTLPELWNPVSEASGFAQGMLAALPRAELALLRPQLEFFPLRGHQVLQESDEAIRHGYFIESGLLSILNVQVDEKNVEVGAMGCGGFVGLTVIDGFETSPHRIVSHSEGAAHRIAVDRLRELMPRCPQLVLSLHRYSQRLLMQSMQLAACNALHEVEQRLARWLLAGRELLRSNELPLTQDILGQLLGTRRSSVTVAAGMLQKAGAISCTRGRITILDTAKLQSMACECYALVQQRLGSWSIASQAAA